MRYKILAALFLSLLSFRCGGRDSTETPIATRGGSGGTGGKGVVGRTGGTGGLSTGGVNGTGGNEDPGSCDGPASAVDGVAVRWERELASTAGPDSFDFFAMPWPEVRRPNSELTGFPNPMAAVGCTPSASGELADFLTTAISPPEYRAYIGELVASEVGTALHPVVYLAFDGPVPHLDGLGALSSLSDDAVAFLMDVDVASPSRGARIPIESRVFENSRYLPESTAAFTPRVGFPLQPSTRYALVIPRTGAGSNLGSPAEFESLKQTGECPGTLAEYTETFDYLDETQGLLRAEIAAMVVLETADPTEELRGLSKVINSTDPAVLAGFRLPTPAEDRTGVEGFFLLEGQFNTLIQQRGAPPHLPDIDVGVSIFPPSANVEVRFDATSRVGELIPSVIATSVGGGDEGSPRTEAIDFTLALPPSVSSVAASEVPLVIYGVGTGGSPQSAVSNGVAAALVAEGYAVLTAESVMHAERAHSENIDSALLSQLGLVDRALRTSYVADFTRQVESGDFFFNPLQLQAARGNVLQNAVDYLWQARLFLEGGLSANVDGLERSISFSSVSFFGHSQGGSTGPLLAESTSLSSMVLSGAGGHIPSVLLGKTKPSDTLSIDSMLDFIVCEESEEPLDRFHPILSLIGHYLEPADAELYAGLMAPARSEMDIFMIQGRGDEFSPNIGQEAIWAAAGLHEVVSVEEVAGSRIGMSVLNALRPADGYDVTYDARASNFSGYTGGFQEYFNAGCSDQHFVFLCDGEARSDWISFYWDAIAGRPTIR